MKRGMGLLAPAVGLLLLGIGAGPAGALSISTVIAPTGSNTPNFINDSLTDYRENRSSTQVLDAGGSTADLVGNNVNAATRYSAVVVADGGIATAPSRTATSNYTVTFTITALPYVVYDLTLDTSRVGALTRVDDGSGGGNASISVLTGTLNAALTPGLGMSAVSLAQGTGNANTPFSQSTPTITLTGLSGNQVITLAFNWTATVNSTCTGSLCSTTGNDEVAVRLGQQGTISGLFDTTADDYPGVGGRNINGDGHFVNINAVITAVPEPGTLVLLGAGVAGLALGGRRRAS